MLRAGEAGVSKHGGVRSDREKKSPRSDPRALCSDGAEGYFFTGFSAINTLPGVWLNEP
jgi:hypothetical protein